MATADKILRVRTRVYSYKQMVDRVDPKRKIRPEPAYKFSNGRTFNSPRDPYISAK